MRNATPKLLRVGVGCVGFFCCCCWGFFFSELNADERYGSTALQTQSCCLITQPTANHPDPLLPSFVGAQVVPKALGSKVCNPKALLNRCQAGEVAYQS